MPKPTDDLPGKTTMKTRVIGVGWDVGGWHGRNNAVVVLEWEDTEKPKLLGDGCKRLPSKVFDLPKFVEHFCGPTASNAVETAINDSKSMVIVAADAPLGYPTAFRELVSNPGTGSDNIAPSSRFIDNPLAFRETDREIERDFGKLPLSVSFDKLGNAASVAILHTLKWTGGDGPLIEKTELLTHKKPHIIEVYPALSKEMASRRATACERYRELNSYPATERPHFFDAWLAAVLALGFGVDDDTLLPTLKPTKSPIKSQSNEGAIWYPRSRDWRIRKKDEAG